MTKNETLEGRQRALTLGILLWGAPKAGKTVLSHTWPRTRTLDFDGKRLESVLGAIREGHIKKDPSELVYRTFIPGPGEDSLQVPPTVLDRATDTLDEWKEELDEFDTLVVDSLTAVSEACITRSQYYLGKNPNLDYKSPDRSQELGFRVMGRGDWGPAMSQFTGFLDQVREFEALGKNVICTAHEYEETTESGLVRAKYPLLIGQLRQRVPKDFQEVWYMTFQDKERGIQTVSDRRVKAGSELWALPDFVPNPTYDKIMSYLN